MTSFQCMGCGIFIGTNYKGNKNWEEHICEPKRKELYESVLMEIAKLDGEYSERRAKILQKLVQSV